MNESPPTSQPTRKSLRSRVTLEPSSTYTINCSSSQLSVNPIIAQNSSQNDTLASRTRRKSSGIPLSATAVSAQSLKVLAPVSSQTYGRSKRKTIASNDSDFSLIQQSSSEINLNVPPEQAVPMKRGPGRPRKHPQFTGASFGDKSDTSETKDILVDRSHSLRANTAAPSPIPLPKVQKRVAITNGASEKVAHRRKRQRLDTDLTIESPRSSLDELRQQWINEREVQLQTVIASHEAILRELYYMEVFQDMTTFDLLKIKDDKSERIAKFMQSHDLWLTVTDQVIQKSQSHTNKISTRHSLNQRRESLVNMLQKSVASSSSIGTDSSSITSSSLNLYRRPSNVKQFSSLEDYLASFVTLSDNEDLTPEQADQRAEQEAEILHRIKHYKSQGLLQPKHAIKPQPEPILPKTIYDNIIEHLPANAKYIRESGKFRRAGAKKVALLVRTYWERLKTKDQREQKEEDRRIRKLAKVTAAEVKKKWRLVERVVEARYKEVLQQEQAQKGKRHLNLILEHSTQVLGHQKEFLGESGPGREEDAERGKRNDEAITEEQDSNDIEYEEGAEEENENDELIEYEESSDDDEELKGLEADKDMPIEELMKRYSIHTNGIIRGHVRVEDYESDTRTDPDMSAGGEEGDESDIDEENEANENEDKTNQPITFDSKQILGSTRVILKPVKMSTKSVELRQVLERADGDENDAEFKETESTYESPDDETTLDAEENIERSEDDEEEMTGLINDVDTPIEVLLQRYGFSSLTTNGQVNESSKKESQTEDIRLDVSVTKVTPTTPLKPLGYGDETEEEILEDKSDGTPSFNVEEDEIDIVGVSDEDRNKPPLAPVILDPEDGSDLSMDEGGKTGEDVEPDPEATETEFEDEVSEDEEMIARKQEKSGLGNKVTSNAVETNDSMTLTVAEPPSGITLATANVKTKLPFLLRGVLREYQRVGLDWLASLYNNGLNGILADEMGLGKTIQTIALLAYLACEKEVWGPHLIVVPTSVMLNWEMEFKKWLPGFKILTYYGNPKERKEKRVGWSKDNSFHVCVTSYQLVVQDQNVFRRKAWRYLILDEAHNIKNFRSQRWQVLLNFNSHRRLLLTGTPLQNNLMELWSLLYFLMPNGVSQNMPIGFANQKEFQEWFSHPLDRMVENNAVADDETRATIQKLHTVLRPYLLRRLKADVEKQMPAKYEHIVYCRLSKRQRFLYDDFMSRAKTRETLASGNFLSIINCLMQLRKVCNHPDLFEVRPIVTSFAMPKIVQTELEIKELLIRKRLLRQVDELRERINLQSLNLLLLETEGISRIITDLADEIDATELFNLQIKNYDSGDSGILSLGSNTLHDLRLFTQTSQQRLRAATKSRWEYMREINRWRYQKRPLYGIGLIDLCRKMGTGMIINIPLMASDPRRYLDYPNAIAEAIIPNAVRVKQGEDIIKRFAFITPKVIIKSDPFPVVSDLPPETQLLLRQELSQIEDIFHPIQIRLQIAFPDKRLLQYDCGKLQKLDELLRDLKAGGHRALIFTQMTRVLDVLEIFLNIHGHRYLRLDGATKVDQRQALTERFNNDTKILVFILSTRSGGLGINLTGADTVVFYDSDWNPCMDRQCQDRAHRIGQTRDVNIFRFVSEFTIEENMLRKANQKRMLDNVVITEGEFTTDYFQKMDWRDLLNPEDLPEEVRNNAENTEASGRDLEQALLAAEDENDAIAAQVAQQEMDMDITEFSEMPPPSATATEKTSGAIEVELNHGESLPIPEQTIGHIDDYMLKFVERELGVYLGFGGVANPDSSIDGRKSTSPTKLTYFTSSSRPSAAPSSISEEDQREREPDDGSQMDTSDYEDPSRSSLPKNQGEHENNNDVMDIYNNQTDHEYNGDIGRDDEEDRYDIFSGEDEVVSGEDE